MTQHYPLVALCALLPLLCGTSAVSAQQDVAQQTVSLPHLTAEVLIYGDELNFTFSTDDSSSYNIDCLNPYRDIQYSLRDSAGQALPEDSNAWKVHAYCGRLPHPATEHLTRVSLEELYPKAPYGTYSLQMTLAPHDRADSVAFAPVTVRFSAWSDESAALVADSLQLLQRFKSSHSFEDLKASIERMSAAFPDYRFTSENLIEQRRTLVQDFMPIFKTIEQSYDPSFDPDNPNDLPDVADLRENDAKAKRASYYADLSMIDDEALSSLEITLEFLRTVRFSGAAPDTAALEDILQRAGLSYARRNQLEPYISALGPCSTPGPCSTSLEWATRTASLPYLTLRVILGYNRAGVPSLGEKFSTNDPQNHSVVCVSGFFDVEYVLRDASGRIVPADKEPWRRGYDGQSGGCDVEGAPDPRKLVKMSEAYRIVRLSYFYPNLPHGTYTWQVTLAPRGSADRATLAPFTIKI